MSNPITTDSLTISPGTTPGALWTYTVAATGEPFAFAPPVFEMDGRTVTADSYTLRPDSAARTLPNGTAEHRWRGTVAGEPSLTLAVVWQVAPDSPIVRFRYELGDAAGRRLTKTDGADALTYLQTSFGVLPSVTEVRLAEFNERVHSYCVSERAVEEAQFAEGLTAMGPILVGASDTHALLLAYEHGSQSPDAFLRFQLSALGLSRTVSLQAVKGNYYDGQPAGGYETPWLHVGAVAGTEDDLARAFRDFLLRYVTQNAASREPYVFYNTWNFQERSRWWYGSPYLESMRQDRIEAEIEVAHKMGIDVFVLDTGWYEKTGDWQVNLSRFPDGLQSIKGKLDGYGMTLGLWFGPTHAAVSSRMYQDHTDCVMTRGGKPGEPHEVWETEASHDLCLVSRYWEAFADELIRLAREVGVTYFKWDAIGQYGCDSPHHFHGTAQNTERERADSYAFQQVSYMARVVNKLCAACPQAIVDFDITEGGRSVGLGFLSAGKYFLINNGPYSHNYDMKPPADGNVNLFFFPGPARAWVCRTPLTYDKWVPSVLFLTHYLPDDPQSNQELNIASLVLGQNGIWGDLLRLSDDGIRRFGAALAAYKQVRPDITRATLTRTGAVGGSPEVYEKIDPNTGRGVVSVFAGARGTYTCLTHSPVSAQTWAMPGVTVTPLPSGGARIDVTFDAPGGKCVFFGAL
jgi:alpha-galactosidase